MAGFTWPRVVQFRYNAAESEFISIHIFLAPMPRLAGNLYLSVNALQVGGFYLQPAPSSSTDNAVEAHTVSEAGKQESSS